jgi:hypothetical protein
MLRSPGIGVVRFPLAVVAAAVLIAVTAMGSHLKVEEGCTLHYDDAEGVRSEDVDGSVKEV